ncbi:DsbA family protein [Massilia sp. ST3]|uniref:DsbA family protein n=1 Tax=Massilia sp. ST3 TaxID=2824903 RepID=UPI001B82DC1C|nr:DsbA family protein [Massilia sp. ST3]MBQ5949274.1 DsbA family protein [Massilia sp. ST3]
MRLIYAGDPMCSWCYGFGKELSALMTLHPGLRLDIVVGGVRAGATDLLDDAGKAFRLNHWERVEANSGLPFNREAFLARENFVYDTEPVCRAVVAARRIAPQADLLAVFRALQAAFYAEGRDTTDGRVLAQVVAEALGAQGFLFDADHVHDVWSAPGTLAETRSDFRFVRTLGVRSFPALLLEVDGQVKEVSPGYAHVGVLDHHLRNLLAQVHRPAIERA